MEQRCKMSYRLFAYRITNGQGFQKRKNYRFFYSDYFFRTSMLQ